jgi:hypothetical protein
MDKVIWRGSEISKCQLCGEEITHAFIDGKMIIGPWAIMCPVCHAINGVGLGTGLGQRYQKEANGEWVKVQG